jgi:hypothetical protein
MTTNGTAVKLPHELDPSPQPDPTELAIGDAVAAAAVVIGGGVAEFATFGQLSAEAKMAGAEALTRLSMFELSYFGDDFAEVALREGKRALWRHSRFREHVAPGLDPAIRERLFDEFLRGALEIAGKAVADERARAQH